MTGNEIERYQPTAIERAPTELDQWVLVVRDVSTLASQIADTPFVPESMRGNPAAVVAAILSGREAGVGPMTALQHIHVIKGRPGQSAQLMRQLVLSAGHSIRYVETSDTRCVVEGRRRGEEQWQRVTFTADQAKRAKINLGDYPEDKLVARATVRLCRRVFADCIGGMPYTIEELADGDVPVMDAVAESAPEPAPATTAKRTAQRRNVAKKEATPPPGRPDSDPPAATDTAEQPAPATGPPLPGEPGYEDPTVTSPPEPTSEPATLEQLQKLAIQLGELEVTDRADKLATIGILVNRPGELSTSKELTKTEASGVIDLLERLATSPDPAKALDMVLAELEQADTEQKRKNTS